MTEDSSSGLSVPTLTPPVAVQVRRGALVESSHRAHIAVVAATGEVTAFAGNPEQLVYPRSTLKPLQAAVMTELGFDPPEPELLALAASSHSGEQDHTDGVQRLLASAGLSAGDLGNVADWPYDQIARETAIAAGHQRSPLFMNCSGKHAAMLATCVGRGWSVLEYLQPGHPLQREIAAGIARISESPLAATTTDGCGAPLWALPLVALARAFSHLTTDPVGSATRTVGDAMRAYPDYVGGSRRDVTELMRAVPGLVAKDGAEGTYAAALADGRAVAIKIEDGANRARSAAMIGVLEWLGIPPDQLDSLRDWEEVKGGGRVVGEFRPVVDLIAAS